MTLRRSATTRFRKLAGRLLNAVAATALPGGLRLFPILAAVDGFIYPHEAVFLRQLARFAPGSGPVVEIGSYHGLSTLCLAHGSRARADARVFAVDPHLRGSESALRSNLRRFGATSRVEVVVSTSLEAASRWSGRARAVFIDGSSEESSVRADFEAWFPFVEEGGFVLLHGSNEVTPRPGPVVVAREFLKIGPRFDSCGRVGSIAWARRRGGVADGWLPDPPLMAPFDAFFGSLNRVSRRWR